MNFMTYTQRGLALLTIGTMVAACMVPVDESNADSAEDLPTETTQELQTTGEDGVMSLEPSCYTSTCKPGPAGDAYCTSICGGEVAVCFSSGYGCGYRPCCVMM
jgi:hypothetical protein